MVENEIIFFLFFFNRNYISGHWAKLKRANDRVVVVVVVINVVVVVAVVSSQWFFF